jgi:penicillin-binding protein-related factor A (putative recombinase)
MKPFESLDQTFDVASQELLKAKKTSRKLSKKVYGNDAEEDYDYVRAMLKDATENLSRITQGAMDVAEQSDHPRAYEVASNAAKSLAETAEKVMDLHKKTKEIDAVEQTKVSEVKTQNNIFMSGSTADLMKALKEAQG